MNKRKTIRNPNQHQPLRDRSQGNSKPSNLPVKGSTNCDQNEVDGIFKNPRFVHACTSLSGATVTIETINGEIFEGIFRAFSPNLEITLSVVHQIDPNSPDKISEDNVEKLRIFKFHEIVKCSAVDTDLEYATKEGFKTDGQISSRANGEAPMKELEPWNPDGSEDTDLHDLSSGDINGWSAEEMFLTNEKQYGVTTTFKSNLEGYTVQLSADRNTKEYREKEAIAAKLAQEIEGNQTSNANIELENGDEEEAFSAVIRPQKSDRSSVESDHQSVKYVPPMRRQNSNSSSGQRDNHRNIPPRHQNIQQTSQVPESSLHDSRGSKPQQHYNRGHHEHSSPSSTSHRDQHGSTGHSHHHDDYGRSAGGGRNSQNTNASSRSGYGNRYEQDSRRGGHVGAAKNRNDQLSELKDFGNKFNLTTSPAPPTEMQEQTSPKTPQQQAGPPIQQQSTPPPEGKDISPPVDQGHSPTLGQEPTSASSAPASSGSSNIQQTKSDPDGSLNLQPSMPSPTSSAAPSPAAVAPTATTPAIVTATVKKSTLNPNAKEFVFNPNAKTFVPGASTPAATMSPGGQPAMSGTPPQRPMTPATPGMSMPIAFPGGQMAAHPLLGTPGVPPQQIIQFAPNTMPGQVYSTSQHVGPYPGAFPPMAVTQAPLPQQHQTRFRMARGHGVNQMEVASPNQILSAAGPPILNPMSPSQAPNYYQSMAQQPNTHMLMQINQVPRHPPGSMNPMLVSQAGATPPMTMTSVSGMMEPTGIPTSMVSWISSQQNQGHPHPMTFVPPPNNSLGAHLGQPPPSQATVGQTHTSVANNVQAVMQQQLGTNGGGGLTPAPSPGPMTYASGPQSLPHQFPSVYMVPPGPNHVHAMQTPPHQPHSMPQYGIPHSVVPGQQNAPHQMIVHPALHQPMGTVQSSAQPHGQVPQ